MRSVLTICPGQDRRDPAPPPNRPACGADRGYCAGGPRGSSKNCSIHSLAMLREAFAFGAEKIGMAAKRSRRNASRSRDNFSRNSRITTETSTPACQASNFATCSSIMASTRGTSPRARLLVLLDDAAQIVNVVEIGVVKLGGSRAKHSAARPGRSGTKRGSRALPWRVRALRA